MPKIEPMSLSWDDTKVLKKVEIIVPGVCSKKGTKQGSAGSVSVKKKLLPKRRSVLDCDKYGPGSRHLWQTDRIEFPALCKDLLGVPEERTRKEKQDSWAYVLCAPTMVKRVGMTLPMRDREGHPLLVQ